MSPRNEPDDPRSSAAGRKRNQPPIVPRDVARAGPESVDRLTTLTHELGGMLDGSMRMLGLALRTLDRARAEQADQSLDQAHRQIESASFALQHMADLVHASMQGATLTIGSSSLHNARAVTLGEAIEHAVRVVTPEAEALGIAIDVGIEPEILGHAAGSLYSVLLNGLRNAMDSVRTAVEFSAVPRTGRIEVAAKLEPAPPGHRVRWVCVTISDDGVGPPQGRDAHRVFEYGFTTKPRGSGVGLALSQSLVREMHGTIQLMPLFTAEGGRGGATLRIAIPFPADQKDTPSASDEAGAHG